MLCWMIIGLDQHQETGNWKTAKVCWHQTLRAFTSTTNTSSPRQQDPSETNISIRPQISQPEEERTIQVDSLWVSILRRLLQNGGHTTIITIVTVLRCKTWPLVILFPIRPKCRLLTTPQRCKHKNTQTHKESLPLMSSPSARGPAVAVTKQHGIISHLSLTVK